MKKPDSITIIGNGAAGTTAAVEIRKRDRDVPVEIISREDAYGYNRPMLTRTIVSGVDESVFYIKPKAWYEENNVKVTLGTNVESIDPETGTLKLSDGTDRKYDVLILATGAEAFVPPIPGHELEGVFSIRHWDDTKKIHDRLDGVTDAVVIGGGVLGLEAAWDLKKAIKNVTVIERSNGMMSRQLDTEGSKAMKLAADGIELKIAFEADTDSIVGKDGIVTGVKLKSGDVIDAQLVVISTGIKQNTDLLAELEGAELTKSIVVNDKMETGIPNIYAIGDCAEAGGINFGIWPQALDMAKTAVANIFGEEKHYKAAVPVNMVSLSNIKLFAIGDNGKKDGIEYDIVEKADAQGNAERFYFADDKLVGGTLIGDISKLSKLQGAFHTGMSKDEFIKEIS